MLRRRCAQHDKRSIDVQDFVGEPLRLCGVQFDNPQIRVGTNPFVEALLVGFAIFRQRLSDGTPALMAVQIRRPLKQQMRHPPILTFDENRARDIVAMPDNRGETTFRLRPTDERGRQHGAGQARLRH